MNPFTISPPPTSPWMRVDQNGQIVPTAPFYQFIVNMFKTAGGGNAPPVDELAGFIIQEPIPSASAVSDMARKIDGLDALAFSAPRPVQEQTARIAALEALAQLTTPHTPDLTQRVAALEAMAFSAHPSPSNDLTQRVAALEALVYGQRLGV